jgi:hypothetical protein
MEEAFKAIMNTKMVNRASIREHMLKMTAAFKAAKVLGAVIDPESQINMVFESLPKSFTQFKLNYNMNKMSMIFSELLKELQAAEKIMKLKCIVFLSKASSSRTKPKAQKFKKKRGSAVRLAGVGPNTKPEW